MKLTSILLFTILLQVSAKSIAQKKVTLHEQSAKLEFVLKSIKNQTGYNLIIIANNIQNAKPITINVKEVDLEDVLQQCFLHQPFTYLLESNAIIVKEKQESNSSASFLGFKISGTVKDELGLPIPGVAIKVLGKSKATTTSNSGKYTIEVELRDSLEFSYLGYKKQRISVRGIDEIDVVMQPESNSLKDVIVVGYGVQKKESVVSSISTVKGEDLAFPTRNLTNNLAGQVSGLIAIQRTGEPGYDDSEFWIRGVSTFAGGSSPLVLVDGVPRKMTDIEPDEIETFSVLKDAAATAVYGAEGANGVVLITSKRGRKQKGVISFRTEHSTSKATRLPEYVGSAEYLTLFNEALGNDGLAPIFSDDLISKYRNHEDPDLYPSTNWLNELLRKNTDNHRYTLNVRGGTDLARYFVSGAYFSESGMFKDDPTDRYENNIGVKRFNLRSNIDMDVSKTTTVSVDLSGQYLLTNYPGVATATIFRQMLITPPYVFPAVYSDGTVSTFQQERDANMRNPYNQLMNSGYAKEWRSGIQSNVRLNQKLDFITAGLTFKGNVSYDYDGNFISKRNYDPSRYNATGRDVDGKLIFSKTYSGTGNLSDPTETSDAVKKVYVESSLNYNQHFGKHTVGAMALYMQKETQLNTEALAFRKQGLVGRATYAFDNRYFVEGNFGYTGSEAFAKEYRFGFFPAIGLGYQLSNESFYPEHLKDVVSSFKLRFSMGRTGNDATGGARFLYRGTYKFDDATFSQGITSAGGVNAYGTGITEARFEAPYLVWEIEDKQNYGVDVGLFKDRVNIVADYFKSERSGILLQRRTTPSVGGFRQAPWENYGKVKNHGVDASIDGKQKFNNFLISARGTFTFARNKITEYDELKQPYPWMAVTGNSVGYSTYYVADRLYTVDDFTSVDNSNGTKSYTLKDGIPKPTLGGKIGPGDIKYKDLNDDKQIDVFDRVTGGDVAPKNPEIVYGFGLNVEYKGFYISSFFQGSGNTSVMLNGYTGWFPFAWGVDQSNYRTFELDRWSDANPNPNALMPRTHTSSANNANNDRASTFWVRNGSFLRLKNMEVGYNLPKTFLNKMKLQTARLYVMGYNLAVWDSINYWDPEVGNGNGGSIYPLPRTFTFGLEVTL
ncbi:SusC/RagA family TonB-linked outer membrane protein [Pedobacter arcticus]|uniref:SusC/RagA family TonB-linked outer membrane protein n=1 Tax=Pedobacter arcticus TaxID=752140 RepID=UPI0012B609BF|nr:TonB-dependent receptor [Pedobacter arcticus]